jgi:hypothetical protein
MSKKQKVDQPAVPVVEKAVEAAVDSVPESESVATEDPRPLFRVTHEGFAQEIHADDENEARALFNDLRKVWPSPREVSVERL